MLHNLTLVPHGKHFNLVANSSKQDSLNYMCDLGVRNLILHEVAASIFKISLSVNVLQAFFILHLSVKEVEQIGDVHWCVGS
jgi:hypothetical protein